MLKQLGKHRNKPPELVDLLLDCHDKIRHFVALARAAGAAEADDGQRAEACEQARRYFAEALPLHVADEEQSLLPRLQGRDTALDIALAMMHAEHASHDAQVAALTAALTSLRDAPSSARMREQVASLAGALAESFAHHLASEETHVFPAVARLLDGEGQRAVLAELRARRR
jgi:hemerythrin-like domain-containing protein